MHNLEKKYPYVEVNLTKLSQNIEEALKRCRAIGIDVTCIVKGFNGIPDALKVYGESSCFGVGSSRFEHLSDARAVGVNKPLMAIRIPMLSEVPDLVRLADMSMNSELTVIKAIDEESARQGKTHGVILMADLGDLREGYWDKQEMVEAAVSIENDYKNIRLLGIGTNLGCYGSILATPEKMEELIQIAENIEAAIGRKLEIISGGATTSLPLVLNGTMPARINHLRMGEGILLGWDLENLWHVDMSFINKDVFTLKAEIIEIKKKPSYPVGEIFVDCFGGQGEYVDRGIRTRALLAVGKVDFTLDSQLVPRVPGVEVIGSSSDHLILDIEDSAEPLKVGDVLEFDLRYSTMVYLTSSKYVRIECKK
ncbi:MAG: alanine racemase [Anaerovoracaceae bacterium]